MTDPWLTIDDLPEDELPTREEMVREIMARPNLDPQIRKLMEMITDNEIKRATAAFIAHGGEKFDQPVYLTRPHGFTSKK